MTEPTITPQELDDVRRRHDGIGQDGLFGDDGEEKTRG